MIHLVQFEPWHLEVLNPWSDPSFTGFMARDEFYRQKLKLWGPAFSGFTSEGDYLGSIGFMKLPWGTVAEIWMVLDKNIANCRKEFHCFVKDRVSYAFGVMGVDRLQAVVEASDERSLKWIEALGFERETKDPGMKSFGPGGVAFHMYSATREG